MSRKVIGTPMVLGIAAVWASSGTSLPLLSGSYGGSYAAIGSLLPILGALTVGFILAKDSRATSAAWRWNPTAFILLFWLAASVAWSVLPNLTISVVRERLLWALLFLSLIPLLTFKERLIAIWAGLGIGLIHSALLIAADSPIALLRGDSAVNGAWLDRNILSHAAVFAVTVGISLVAMDRRWLLPVVVEVTVAIWLIARSGSRTPLFAVPVAVLAVVSMGPTAHAQQRGLGWRSIRRHGIFGIGVFVLGVTSSLGALRSSRFWSSTLGDISFVGRVTYWKRALPYFQERPLNGWGFGNVLLQSNRGETIRQRDRFPLAHMHNGFIEAAVDGGLIALLLLVWLCGCAIRKSWQRCAVGEVAVGGAGIFVVVSAIVINLTEPDFLTNLPATLFAVAAVAAPITRLDRDRVTLHQKRFISLPRSLVVFVVAAVSLAGIAFAGARLESAAKRLPLGRVWADCGPLSPTSRSLAEKLGGGPEAPLSLFAADPPPSASPAQNLASVRGFDRPAIRELRLQCGFVHAASESHEVVSRVVLAQTPSLARLPELDTLGRELSNRPDLVTRFSESGHLSVIEVLRWASDIPADDPAYGALVSGSVQYAKILRSMRPHAPWWVRAL